MARPTTLKGSKVLIELGDGASPEDFDAPCALNTKGLNMSAQVNEFEVADCDDEDAAVFIERVVRALSASVPASGTLAMESWATWRVWFLSALEKNIRVHLVDESSVQPGYMQMSAVLTTLNLTAERGGLAQIEVNIDSNGEFSWVDE